MPEPEFIRVTDGVTPKREYTINVVSFDKNVHTKVDKPATRTDGTVLPPKYTPESLSSKGGQQADTEKEKH